MNRQGVDLLLPTALIQIESEIDPGRNLLEIRKKSSDVKKAKRNVVLLSEPKNQGDDVPVAPKKVLVTRLLDHWEAS